MRWLLILQMSIYFHACLTLPWMVIHVIGLSKKYSSLNVTYQFLGVTGFGIMFFLEIPRLLSGYFGNMLQKPALIMGFWLITTLITLPIQSFFLFAGNAKNIPLEVIVDSIIVIFLVIESIAGVFSVKKSIQSVLKQDKNTSKNNLSKASKVE